MPPAEGGLPAPASAPATGTFPLGLGVTSAAAAPAPATPPRIDREFVIKNRLVERYIGGRLPLRGAQDLERFCREHPELLEEIHLSQNIHAAVRLLDTAGQPAPWEPPPKLWWQRPQIPIAAGLLAVVLAVTALLSHAAVTGRDREIAHLKQLAAAQPLDPATSTRTITVIPNRVAPSRRSLATLGGGGAAQMADLKIDVSWSPFKEFRVTIDRIDQGRVALLHNVLRDSSGVLHLELNSSALGPGDYQFTIEGLNWKGEPTPQAWATLSVAR
jgi:hypothetical protein